MEKSRFTASYQILRKRLRTLREKAGLTVRQLASRTGTDHTRIWRIEIGERRIDLVEFFWLLEALGVEPERELLALAREFRKRAKQGKQAHRPRQRAATRRK